MSNTLKENIKNKYWLINDDVFELHLCIFDNDEIILKFIQDKSDSRNYIYVSDVLNVEYEEIIADSIEKAMEQLEDIVIEHIQNKIFYYEEMLQNFNDEG